MEHSNPVTEEQKDSEMSAEITEHSQQPAKKMDTINENEEHEIEMTEEDDVVLFVETKYCTICHLEQPIRAKHCKSCDQCVATHDHHCPWIGNCVGERNKARFYHYLVL